MEKRSLKSTLADFCFSNHAQLELGSPAGGREQEHGPCCSADQVHLCRWQQWPKLAWEHCQDKVGMQAKHSAALMQPTYCLTFA